MDIEGHHQQKQHVGYRQIQHVDVRDHFLLAYRHRVDDQPVGDDPHRAQDAVNGRENVHEGGDVHEAVGRRRGAQTGRAGEVVGLVGLAECDGVVHLRLPLMAQRARRSAVDPVSKLGAAKRRSLQVSREALNLIKSDSEQSSLEHLYLWQQTVCPFAVLIRSAKQHRAPQGTLVPSLPRSSIAHQDDQKTLEHATLNPSDSSFSFALYPDCSWKERIYQLVVRLSAVCNINL